MLNHPLNFQSIILSLSHFWVEHGCLLWQPYYSQVGAGTYNPATFLRVLGPEPWNVAYVEPSIRPDDGRFGENPNRMQMHYQFQVILKPDPGNPQEIYLQSLEALGIDLRKHDIRFVEDNWESPALGAWGLGWEVWLDGQEITQFTYFQQAGGQILDPVAVELTYGLDRIAIALQRTYGFTDIRWDDNLTCGDVNLQAEQEHSKYYFEVADVERNRRMYDLFEAEAAAALERGLVLPAHDFVLKCSHTFNVLDTRGAIGVTERAAYFKRMRELSRRVAEAFLEQRQRLEYPFLKDEKKQGNGEAGKQESRVNEGKISPSSQLPSSPTPLLLEIGVEELPAADLDSALEQLRAGVPTLLTALRLKHGKVKIYGTPRRLVVYVEDLSPRQADVEQVIKGPPASRAFDALGQPTPAAIGFARSKGVEVSALQVRAMDGGSYVTAIVHSTGRPAPHVLAEALPKLIASLRFDKTMRWNHTNVTFSRPIRWLLALFGDAVIPFDYAAVRSGNCTRGLRFHEPAEIVVHNADEYFAALAAQGIVLDIAERQRLIGEQINTLAAEVGGFIPHDPDLLAEVANLVEAPTALRGAFAPTRLKIPGEVLTAVMKKHQRYFPLVSHPDSPYAELLPHFIAVRNGDTYGLDLVVEGNEHVLNARFADADFFIREDLKKSLTDFLPRLGTLTFQLKLGSMLDKAHRLRAMMDDLSMQLNLDAAEAATARRAAELCKADLATKMVVEMTSLQGVMGRYYARRSGEAEAAAAAIFEHYLPRFAGDTAPTTRPALAVGLADRLDTLAGLFAAGLAPSGAKDPFALRRTALGLVSNLIAWNIDFDLRAGLALAVAHLPIPMNAEAQSACLTFIVERLRNLLLEEGQKYDVVDAVLTAQGHNPAGARRAVAALLAWVNRSDWRAILPAYARCVRITRDQKERFPVNPQAFTEDDEKLLYSALLIAEASLRKPYSVDELLNAFLPMIPSINSFFDTVLVMDEDLAKQRNRLGLLQRIAALAEDVADFSKLEGF
jgi:glycyl-tRNA synthetase